MTDFKLGFGQAGKTAAIEQFGFEAQQMVVRNVEGTQVNVLGDH